METQANCPRCGRALPEGEARCPACERQPWWRLSRESLLLGVFVAAAIALFVVTSFAARLFHEQHDRLGEEWFARGQQRLEAGDAEGAVHALRNALLYHRDHFQYRMLLARALLRAGHTDEARSYLLSLWQREPGHGILNLELARFAADRSHMEEAVRYYQNAIHGLWPEHAEQRRRQARLELIRFLLSQEATEEARAQVAALTAEMPSLPDLHAEAGQLFLRTGDHEQALAQFEAALEQEPRHPEALLGAGRAAFQVGNYVGARRHLAAALKQDGNSDVAQLLETTNLIIQTDPFRWRLGSQERVRRTVRAFEQSVERLEACARQTETNLEEGEGELQLLYERVTELRPRVTAAQLRRNPDMLEIVMDAAFGIQRATARHCGEPQGVDHALLLIARRREVEQ